MSKLHFFAFVCLLRLLIYYLLVNMTRCFAMQDMKLQKLGMTYSHICSLNYFFLDLYLSYVVHCLISTLGLESNFLIKFDDLVDSLKYFT